MESSCKKQLILPCYLRLEAGSGIDPETGEALFLWVTNPIWIVEG